ncbi:hypothetical protein LP416_14290 [Polaromonas sp. P2-4]|nr:hypothetical protein LP416_14290 [Polaromonas sp. P2-4]
MSQFSSSEGHVGGVDTAFESALGIFLVEHIGDRQAVEHEAGFVEVASLVVSDQGFSGMGGNGHGELQKKMV